MQPAIPSLKNPLSAETEVTLPNTGQQVKILLLGAVFSALLFSASLAIPFAGFIAGFLAAAPLAYTRIFTGIKFSVMAAILAALLVGSGFKPAMAVWYLMQCGLSGILVPHLLLNGRSNSSVLLISTAAATVATAITALAFSALAGQGINALATREIMTGVDQVIAVYEQQKSISKGDIELIRQGMKRAGDLMTKIYPALATINLLLLNTITFFVSRRIAKVNAGLTVAQYSFREFKTPEILIWPLLVSGFSLLAQQQWVTVPALNILALLLPLYFLQGLAVVIALSDKSQYSTVIKIMFAVLLLTQPYLIVVVTIAGLFDLWGEFRIPRKTREENL